MKCLTGLSNAAKGNKTPCAAEIRGIGDSREEVLKRIKGYEHEI